MDLEKLQYMASQIARNLETMGHDEAVAATFDHIIQFWAPRMRAAIISGSRSGLSPIAAAAVERLAALHVTP